MPPRRFFTMPLHADAGAVRSSPAAGQRGAEASGCITPLLLLRLFLLRFQHLVAFPRWLCGPRRLLRSVDHGDHINLVGLDVIDDPEGAFQHFPYLREFDFRDDAAGLGEIADLLGASGETINDSQGVLW